MGSTADFSLYALSIRSSVSGSWQHRVFGRYPTFSGALFEAGNTLGERGVAQDSRVPKRDKAGTFGVHGKVSFETNLPEFRVGSIVLPSH
jgi:hypothetical protein